VFAASVVALVHAAIVLWLMHRHDLALLGMLPVAILIRRPVDLRGERRVGRFLYSGARFSSVDRDRCGRRLSGSRRAAAPAVRNAQGQGCRAGEGRIAERARVGDAQVCVYAQRRLLVDTLAQRRHRPQRLSKWHTTRTTASSCDLQARVRNVGLWANAEPLYPYKTALAGPSTGGSSCYVKSRKWRNTMTRVQLAPRRILTFLLSLGVE
jgi:hypothetical protein